MQDFRSEWSGYGKSGLAITEILHSAYEGLKVLAKIPLFLRSLTKNERCAKTVFTSDYSAFFRL